MEEQILNKHQHWSYKFIGEADADKLEYILMDVEVFNALTPPRYISDEALITLREFLRDKPRIRIYHSKEFNQFLIEPYTEEK